MIAWPSLFFYRDSNGNEVDLVIPRAQHHVPVEVKAAATVSRSLFKGLQRFSNAVAEARDPVLVYSGDDSHTQEGVRVTNLPGLNAALMDLFPDSSSA